jgi:membrane protease YdiL (CAAX protease family)
MHAVGHGNPWIADVEADRRPVPAWLTALIGIGFAVGILMIVPRGLSSRFGEWVATAAADLGAPWPDMLARAAPAMLIFGGLYGVAAAATAFEGRPLWRLRGRWPLALLAGLAVGAGAFCASVAIVGVAGDVTAAASAPRPSVAGALILGALLVAFQVSAEEAYFRGWLQPVFCAHWGPWMGLGATALLFGALHVIAGAQGPLAIFNLVLGGLMFGLLALRSGGLIAPAAAHFGWNWTESGGLGLTHPAGGSLAALRLAGGDLWSGGPDGMNGSPALTLALAIVVAILIRVGPNPSARPEARRSGRAPRRRP